jgi:hypothetical protein
LGIGVERSKRILEHAISTYERRIVALKNYSPTPEIKETCIAPSRPSVRQVQALQRY